MPRNIYDKCILSIQVRKLLIPFEALAGYLSVSSCVYSCTPLSFFIYSRGTAGNSDGTQGK